MGKKTAAELEQERLEVMLERERLDLDEAKDRNAQRMQMKAANSLKNKQRQAQLQTDLHNRDTISAGCSHKQGGSPSNQYGGKGATALKLVYLPDGFTELIMCAICRLRRFSPHPMNQAKKIFEGENATARDARVAKYRADKDAFDALRELTKDTLTPEAAIPMHCGVTIQTTNLETGMPTMRPRPCDSYAVALY